VRRYNSRGAALTLREDGAHFERAYACVITYRIKDLLRAAGILFSGVCEHLAPGKRDAATYEWKMISPGLVGAHAYAPTHAHPSYAFLGTLLLFFLIFYKR
jgi:hypothetical protein